MVATSSVALSFIVASFFVVSFARRGSVLVRVNSDIDIPATDEGRRRRAGSAYHFVEDDRVIFLVRACKVSSSATTS